MDKELAIGDLGVIAEQDVRAHIPRVRAAVSRSNYDASMANSADLIAAVRRRFLNLARITPESRAASRFARFGAGSAIAFAPTEIFGERYVAIGRDVLFGPRLTLTAGLSPGHILPTGPVVTIGDRCVIGQGAGIVGISGIHIGTDVWTGHNVYITDFNHGYEDTTIPPGQQLSEARPVHIGDGAWIGNGATVLPGVSIGRNSVIGAGSVVTKSVPDLAVAVGNPARVVRRFDVHHGWTSVR